MEIGVKDNTTDEIEEEIDFIGKSTLEKAKERKSLRLNYDSDSTDDDYAKENENIEEEHKDDDAEDDDMFASDDDKEVPPVTKGDDIKQSISPEYGDDNELDMENIHAYYNNVESTDDFLTFKEAKLTEPKMEAFIEKEEDFEDTYNPPKEEDKELPEDLWAADFKKDDIMKAKKAQEQRKAVKITKLKVSTEELLYRLIGFLEPVETPLEALARFRPMKRKNKKQKNPIDEESRKKNVLEITDLCEDLINDKRLEVYEMTKEELIRAYTQETGKEYKASKKRPREEEDSTEEYGEKIWEFKWSENDTVNGLFSTHEMVHWKDTYFTDEVLVKRINSSDFLLIRDIDFDE